MIKPYVVSLAPEITVRNKEIMPYLTYISLKILIFLCTHHHFKNAQLTQPLNLEAPISALKKTEKSLFRDFYCELMGLVIGCWDERSSVFCIGRIEGRGRCNRVGLKTKIHGTDQSKLMMS